MRSAECVRWIETPEYHFAVCGSRIVRITVAGHARRVTLFRAEPSRAEPSRAEPSRAEPSRADEVVVKSVSTFDGLRAAKTIGAQMLREAS